MFSLILFFVKLILFPFRINKRQFIINILLIKKENTILKRTLKSKKIKFRFLDKLFYTLWHKISNKSNQYLTLIKPVTILKDHIRE